METKKKEPQVLQWHPAFYAGIQIEFEKEAEKLIFENEHQLGTKPKEIDVLIIKKEADEPLQTNIGEIFRKHNIVEYKSPDDYLSIDDFYKVYGYACFYKSDAENVNKIGIDDITITFVCHNCPNRLVQHWKHERNYHIEKRDKGVYYIQGDKLPIQLILTSQLAEEKNFWLKNLTNCIKEKSVAEKLIEEYEKHRNSGLYKSVMDIIVRANKRKFEEVRGMCDALRELMQDEIDKAVELQIEQMKEQIIQQTNEEITQRMTEEVTQRVTEEVTQQVTSQVRQEGIKSLIEVCQELGVSKEDTFLRVKRKCSLTENESEEAIVKYWKEIEI
uniref:3-isopropylmalate dehydrogenase n=1 Tax=Acetatifactor sp. TaxID=1872090 RepID=UPI004056050A